MAIRQYDLTWNYATVSIAIDDAVMTKQHLTEINSFWSDADVRLDHADGSVELAVVKRLAGVCFYILMDHGLNTQGLIWKFDWDYGRGVEGWPKMDGSSGILICDSEVPLIDDDDIEISTKSLDVMPNAPKAGE